jgi:hypothetical protein
MSLTAFEKFKIKLGAHMEVRRSARRCWLWHSWGEWKVDREGEIAIEHRVKGFYLEQSRQCLRCKVIEKKNQSLWI